ncbi:MAG: hypothetical protein KGJ57_06850 [Sphingomonadales bacterium]|nr:hypothetical protein [Sphingomonadales bacterium]MDE2169132.1 hypothetical protein [Sphingomonadales bacterium]
MRRELVERNVDGEGEKRSSTRGPRRTVTVNLAESPLTWLHARGHLSDRELAAGEQLRRDYEAAQLSPGITMRWEPVRIKGGHFSGLNASERQIAAKRRFDEAVGAAGKGLGDILWRVVCAGETLPEAEKGLAWPVRSGKLVLKLALERVADYHRLP